MSSCRPLRLWTLSAALVLGLAVVSAAFAAKVKKPVSPFATQIAQLRAARLLLAEADRDYKGHRAAAVKRITAAIHALNLDTAHRKHAHPKPKGGGERQDASDAQLKKALQVVQNVQGQLAGTDDLRAVTAAGNLKVAVKELQTALEIN